VVKNKCHGTTSALNQGALGVTKGFGDLGNGQGQEVTENDFLTRDVGTTLPSRSETSPPFSAEIDVVKSTTKTTDLVDLSITLW
jgi:hypothetical protein